MSAHDRFDEDEVCKSCGQSVAVRDDMEHTGFCDQCAQNCIRKIETAGQKLAEACRNVCRENAYDSRDLGLLRAALAEWDALEAKP